MNVLHITYWYPNKGNKNQGIFIEEHITALDSHCNNFTLHINSSYASCLFKYYKAQNKRKKSLSFQSFIFKYYVFEKLWSSLVLLWNFIFTIKFREFDKVNFHIAPPLCTYLSTYKKVFLKKTPVYITEHYTGYHTNFQVKSKKNKKLNQIRNIFKTPHYLITVSNQLKQDIDKFCEQKNKPIQSFVIPNIVSNHFKSNFKSSIPATKNEAIVYAMIGNWNGLKKPIQIINAFIKTPISQNKILYVFGDGCLIPEMKKIVQINKMNSQVIFWGRQPKKMIAKYLKETDYLLHNSLYETFSVVTAEGLCSGCKIIATYQKAIEEYLRPKDGMLLKDIDEKNWTKALELYSNKINPEERLERSKYYFNKFSSTEVGKQYFNALNKSG